MRHRTEGCAPAAVTGAEIVQHNDGLAALDQRGHQMAADITRPASHRGEHAICVQEQLSIRHHRVALQLGNHMIHLAGRHDGADIDGVLRRPIGRAPRRTRTAAIGRTLRGIGALAVTTAGRSAGWVAAGA